jgi:hypothetical protein
MKGNRVHCVKLKLASTFAMGVSKHCLHTALFIITDENKKKILHIPLRIYSCLLASDKLHALI